MTGSIFHILYCLLLYPVVMKWMIVKWMVEYMRLFLQVIPLAQREPTNNIVVIWVKIFQTEIMAEIYSKSLVRVIGKVLPMT